VHEVMALPVMKEQGRVTLAVAESAVLSII
jgi:hypothetical protein